MFDDSDIDDMQDQIEKLVNQVHVLEVKAGLKRNVVFCTVCNKMLESTYTHDFQQCGCDNKTFCDGGTEYQRIGGMDMSKIKVLNTNSGILEDCRNGKID